MPRSILHVDMDAFFASVEQLDDPSLRGKPVLIGHDGPRGVVAAASYEARPYGCRSAQPMAIARRNCPHAIVLPVRMWRYVEVSDQVFAIFDAFSPLVEPLSVDEAFLDVTGTERLLGSPAEIARKLRQRIKQETGLTASVGVAPNKFLAKLASDMNKPDGLTVIEPADVDRVMPPMPVTRLWGIGPATAAKLERWSIRTVADLRRRSVAELAHILGNEAEWYHRLAHGLDDRPVTPDRAAKSIGHEQTFEADIDNPEQVAAVLLAHVEQVGRRLRKSGLRARSVALKIRYGEFETISRQTSLDAPTDVTAELWQAARTLFEQWVRAAFRPVRLIGVSAAQLAPADEGQLDLFADPARARQRQLDAAADAIVARFGKAAIHRAATAAAEKRRQIDTSMRHRDD